MVSSPNDDSGGEGVQVMVVEKLEGADLYIGFTVAEGVSVSDPDSLLKGITAPPGLEVQFMDSSKVAGRWHIRLAVMNAVKAFHNGANISRRLPIEIMLYASGQRQIDKAFKMLGVRRGVQDVLVVALGDREDKVASYLKEAPRRLGGKPCPEKIEKWSKKKIREIIKEYGITRDEIYAVKRRKVGLAGAIERIVLERVALLSI